MATNNAINNAGNVFLVPANNLSDVASAATSRDNLVLPSNTARNITFAGNADTNPWQRGTTFTGVVVGATVRTADMWHTTCVGAGQANFLKTGSTLVVPTTGMFNQFVFEFDVTTVDAAIAASDRYEFGMRIEGYDWAQIAQRPFTISFWVNCFKPGIYCVSVSNSAGDRSYVHEFTASGGVYDFVSFTVPASPAAGTWNYTNGLGLAVRICVAAGTDFQTTADAWQVGNFTCTANQVNGMDNVANYIRVTFLQVEGGNVATSFAIMPEQEVLAKCQRYYNKTFDTSIAPAQASGSNNGILSYRASVAGANANGALFTFPVKMRTAPTMTGFNPVSAASSWYDTNASANSGASSFQNIGERSAYATNAQVAGTAVTAQINLHVTAEAGL